MARTFQVEVTFEVTDEGWGPDNYTLRELEEGVEARLSGEAFYVGEGDPILAVPGTHEVRIREL